MSGLVPVVQAKATMAPVDSFRQGFRDTTQLTYIAIVFIITSKTRKTLQKNKYMTNIGERTHEKTAKEMVK